MNMLVNAVQLIGRLGADVEINTTTQGTKVANVRLATNEYAKNSEGEWIETTYWHSLVFWGKQAERLEKSGKKGTKLMIQGSLIYREYVDVHEIRREVTDIRVQNFMILESAYSTERAVVNNDALENDEAPF